MATTTTTAQQDQLTKTLTQSLRTVPSAAVPPMLDCIISSTSVSPSSLFHSLLSLLPSLTTEIVDDENDNSKKKKLDSEECAFLVSYLRALSHLLNKTGGDSSNLESFIWDAFVPLMKKVQLYEREMVTEIVHSLLEVVIESNNRELVGATLVPFLLRSVCLSMDGNQVEDLSVIKWSRQSGFKSSRSLDELGGGLGGVTYPPLTLSCYICSCLLDAALENYQAAEEASISSNVGPFCGHFLRDLCNITIQMLSQSVEHRLCVVRLLLPSLLKAFVSKCSFNVCIDGESHCISRQVFFMELWKCSSMLFALGAAERRDAYGIISLYLSYFSCIDGPGVDMRGKAEEFDIRAEKGFWDELKRGLIDKEGLVRKQSLHILKKVLLINEGDELDPKVTEKKPYQKGPVPDGMTKRDMWAEEEARSLGVAQVCLSASSDTSLSKQKQWEAFILLYEMLEEFGTHLLEAAWNHQLLVLLRSYVQIEDYVDPETSNVQIDALGGNFEWLAILWERGLSHDNPLVRCLIMQSFLDIDWKNEGNCRKMFPEEFVLGGFMQGLNDPVHQKDFGLKGVYSSKTIEGASKFLSHYSSLLCRRERISLLCKLASVARQQSLGRVGLMSLSECIYSVSAVSADSAAEILNERVNGINVSPIMNGALFPKSQPCKGEADLIDGLRFLIENSKQHFNPNYRVKVCEKVIKAAASAVHAHEITLETLLYFLAALPRDFTDQDGLLKTDVQKWLTDDLTGVHARNCSSAKIQLLHNLFDFPQRFTAYNFLPDGDGHQLAAYQMHFDDEDLLAWCTQSERWARVLFLLVDEEPPLLQPLLMFMKREVATISHRDNQGKCVPTKLLILILSLVHELEMLQQRTCNDTQGEHTTESKVELHKAVARRSLTTEKFADVFLVILEDLISFAELSCSIFWSKVTLDGRLPGSVTGKLGGPSQRRLSSSLTTAVLEGIVSVRAVASVSSWCTTLRQHTGLDVASTFLWKFFFKVVSLDMADSETSAEIQLGAYEALSFALKAAVPVLSSSSISLIKAMNNSLDLGAKDKPILDPIVLMVLKHVDCFLAIQPLARARRAVLMNLKWLCVEAILSMPYYARENKVHVEHFCTFFSGDAVRLIFRDLVESLDNAGESSVLPMLRSVRVILDLSTSGRSFLSSYHKVDAQMMWQLVRSSWILHTSCKKRRVAPIAALLSSVLHVSVFRDVDMHVEDNGPGPLKWFCERILEEGMKSPRTIRLAALHLTGLWLLNPRIIKYYTKELRVLTLYGSVAFDEDFEAELTENADARAEVSLLSKIPDCELTEAYINTELYARVSVAVLFYKLVDLAQMLESENKSDDSRAAFESGKLFLLELLDYAVEDKDLAKELYKKYSATHRRKVRAWQMLCVLSRFVDQDNVQQVMHSLSISLYRNNLPAVRQYLETFAIQVYLKFPFLVGEHLVPILHDYNMKTQALSSYVFIAANVILHSKEVQSKRLDELLPPLLPLLTSHHHTLRGFTQLLVYQVFCKVLPVIDTHDSAPTILEKRCFANLKSYLAMNPDCLRLRASMERFLDSFSPDDSVNPAGIFSNRIEDLEFECVPASLMERVMNFLNDVREELRCSMAKDEVTLKNESLMSIEDPTGSQSSKDAAKQVFSLPVDLPLDFQKKFTFSKHEMPSNKSGIFLDPLDFKPLLEMEKEDLLLEQMLHFRVDCMEKLRANRQQLILVASLLDRIPNLAGLARTCEVFKASGLVVADDSVVKDKQFQLISVTAEKWIPIIEVPVNSIKNYLEKKKREGFSILGLEQTANSIPLDEYSFPPKTVLVLGREKEGIPADIIHVLDACIEIPQLGVVRSLNVHVSGAIATWEYTRQQRLR